MKTHASYLVMSNQMLHEFPQGDPYSGPAYGDKHKSKGLGMVLGVVASVATMGAAAPLLAGPTLAGQLAGGAMMAGGVMSGVGAITGNKKLMKIGGVLSLAGGLGNMAAGALGIGQGAGSQAVSQFGTNFMESVNSLGVGDIYSAEAIAAGKAASGGGTIAGGAAETAVNEAGSQTLQLAGESGVGGMDGQTLDLAKSELASAQSSMPTPADAEGPMTNASMDKMNLADGGMDSNMRAIQNKAPGILSNAGSSTPSPAAGSGIDYAKMGQLGDAPAAAGGPQVLAETGKEASTLDKALAWMEKNPTVTKIGAGMLDKAMAAAAGDDQVSALIDRYKAETNLLTTKNDVEKYKLANAGKQVAMISADDPNLDAKVKQATASGIPVAFVPAVGQNYTPVSKNFTPVARNATYNQPTA